MPFFLDGEFFDPDFGDLGVALLEIVFLTFFLLSGDDLEFVFFSDFSVDFEGDFEGDFELFLSLELSFLSLVEDFLLKQRLSNVLCTFFPPLDRRDLFLGEDRVGDLGCEPGDRELGEESIF